MPGLCSRLQAARLLERPFLALAAAVNDTLSADASPLEDRVFGSGLMLATDSVGQNSQPDVWGSGLAVQIGAGTAAQRARMQTALAANASNIFRWGQARHLIWPMCWQKATPYPGFMNQNECTETGGAPGDLEHSWCGGKPCGFYQNGGYWSTPLGWLLPAVARANFSLAASLLQAVARCAGRLARARVQRGGQPRRPLQPPAEVPAADLPGIRTLAPFWDWTTLSSRAGCSA